MASERKGKAYEAAVLVALQELRRDGVLNQPVHWGKTPAGATVQPDFSIGDNENDPDCVIQVTHSGSIGESHKKLWRNLGELVEIKTCLPRIPRVFSLTFGIIKQDLEPIQVHAFDEFQWSRGEPWHDALGSLTDELSQTNSLAATSFPDEIRRRGSREVIKSLKALLRSWLEAPRRTQMDSLWRMHRKRTFPSPPAARDTFYRRGLSKAALLGEVPQKSGQLSQAALKVAELLSELSDSPIVRPTISGPRVVDTDLIWISQCGLTTQDLQRLMQKGATAGFRKQIQKVRSVGLLDQMLDYVVTHLDELKCEEKMLQLMERLHEDPSHGLRLDGPCEEPTNVWIFDVVGALLRARSKRAQSFGYSTFSSHRTAADGRIGTMNVGTWCSAFMNQYFNRQVGFSPPAAAKRLCARVLSDALMDFDRETVQTLKKSIVAQYIRREVEAILVAHGGFDPLGALLKDALGNLEEVPVDTCFREAAGMTGGAGRMLIGKVKNTLIHWQSAHGSHTNDKKKELCGRAVGLRYHWNGSAFVPRPGVKKLILVLDGTWKDEDIQALVRAGWDEIYYPDEMDRLVKAIV